MKEEHLKLDNHNFKFDLRSYLGINLGVLCISFIRFVKNPNSSIMVIMNPEIGLSIANHRIIRLGFVLFQCPLWYASNCVIVWFTDLIIDLLLILLSIESIGPCSDVHYYRLLSIPVLVHICSQRDYLLLSSRQRSQWAIFIQFMAENNVRIF